MLRERPGESRPFFEVMRRHGRHDGNARRHGDAEGVGDGRRAPPRLLLGEFADDDQLRPLPRGFLHRGAGGGEAVGVEIAGTEPLPRSCEIG